MGIFYVSTWIFCVKINMYIYITVATTIGKLVTVYVTLSQIAIVAIVPGILVVIIWRLFISDRIKKIKQTENCQKGPLLA